MQDFLTWQGQLLGNLLDLDAAPALGCCSSQDLKLVWTELAYMTAISLHLL